MKQRDKKKYIIVGLCAILVVMAVGYASFASNLTINGTSEIASNWCLGFDNTKTNALVPSKTHAAGQNPTGTISYDGGTCGVKSQFGATVSAHLNQPGDSIEYTLTILNEGSLDAAIDSISVNGQNIVSDKTVTDGNVVFAIGMPETTTLSAGDSTTMTVTARFQDETDITGVYNGENRSISISINAKQDDGNGGFEKKFTGYIYRKNGNNVYQDLGGKSLNLKGYIFASDSTGSIGPREVFDTIEDCHAAYTDSDGYSCQPAINAFGNYTTDFSEIQNNSYYLKHQIEDDIMTESYVCFIMGGKEKCIKGYDTTAYSANQQILREYQTYYASQNASCSFDDSMSQCTSNAPYSISVQSSGNVVVYDSGGGPNCLSGSFSGLSVCVG